MKNKVSVWVGEFKSDEELKQYMYLNYADDDDFPTSKFTSDFNIDFYDDDFCEAYYSGQKKQSWHNLIKPISYSETFIHQIPDITDNSNSVIALYNFEYKEYQINKRQLLFIGTFDFDDES